MLRVLLTRQCQIENIVWKLDSTHSFSVFFNCEWIHLIMVLYESHKIPIHYFLVCVVATNCWRLEVWIDPSWKQLNQTFTPNAISKILGVQFTSISPGRICLFHFWHLTFYLRPHNCSTNTFLSLLWVPRRTVDIWLWTLQNYDSA